LRAYDAADGKAAREEDGKDVTTDVAIGACKENSLNHLVVKLN
jgi:hypothetical protein